MDVDPEIAFLINMEFLCERYSQSPQDLLKWDAYYLKAFQSILKGKKAGMESKGGGELTAKQIEKM